jgi:hypothetical protein
MVGLEDGYDHYYITLIMMLITWLMLVSLHVIVYSAHLISVLIKMVKILK